MIRGGILWTCCALVAGLAGCGGAGSGAESGAGTDTAEPGTVAALGDCGRADDPVLVYAVPGRFAGGDQAEVDVDGVTAAGEVVHLTSGGRSSGPVFGAGGLVLALTGPGGQVADSPAPANAVARIGLGGDGTVRQVYAAPQVESVAPSPDGSRIAVASWDPGQAGTAPRLFVAPSDGTSPARLTTEPDGAVTEGWAAWSPDSARIAYLRAAVAEDGTRQAQLMVVDVDPQRRSPSPARVLAPGTWLGEPSSLSWSADGSALLASVTSVTSTSSTSAGATPPDPAGAAAPRTVLIRASDGTVLASRETPGRMPAPAAMATVDDGRLTARSVSAAGGTDLQLRDWTTGRAEWSDDDRERLAAAEWVTLAPCALGRP